MKKLLVLISVLLALCFIFVSCGETNTPSSSEQGTTQDTGNNGGANGGANGGSDDTQASPDTGNGGGVTDEGNTGSTDEENGDSTDESNGDSTDESNGDVTDESGSESSDENSSSSADKSDDENTDIPPENDDLIEDEYIPEPDVPDGPIDIAVGGLSSYVVVYEANNTRVKEFAEKFVNYMSTTHKITLEMVEYSDTLENDLCIYVGNVKETRRIRARMNSANDFGACVSGNDYVLCATNDRLYEYLYDVLVEKVLYTIRSGNWSTKPQKDFIYSQSDYKDISYINYLFEKLNTGISKTTLFPVIFEDRLYEAADGTKIPYRLYVPYDYDTNKEYPVVLFLHGANDRGSDNLSSMNHMIETLYSHENSPFWDSIVIIPQCPLDEQWVDTPWKNGGYRVEEVPESNELKAVVEILGLVSEEFPTDKDRYYVTGLSMGGFGTWDLIMRHPELFAAAVPLCGGGDYTQAYKLIDMPIWTIHDKRDYDVPFSGTKEMIVALDILGSTVLRYEEPTGYGHDVWSYAARTVEIWTWLFEQTREGR